MNRSRKNNMGTKPTSLPPLGNNNANNIGYLTGNSESNLPSSRRQQRVQNFKNMPPVITPVNNGLKGLMINQNSSFEITPQINNSMMTSQLNMPSNVKEKLTKWREERQKKQMSTGHLSSGSSSSFQSPPKLLHVPSENTKQLNTTQFSNSPNIKTSFFAENVREILNDQKNDSEVSQLAVNLDGYHEFMSSGGKLPLELMDDDNNNITNNNNNNKNASTNLPLSSSLPLSSPPPPTALQSLFDTTGQEILKGMVDVEVKKILDQLKKERPELLTQTDLMNQINLKNRKIEDSLQQFNIHNQRLKDTVDQLSISIKAVQSNIDHVKHESGGSGLTEEVMRSWVLHFFTEQIGNLKKDFQEEFYKTNEKINQFGGVKSNELKIVENNLKLLETKFQNTLQNIFESFCFVYATAVEKVSIYTFQDVKSTVINTINPGEEILLNYPILKDDNNRWMKARIVDRESAQLTEGYIPIFLNNVVLLNNFHL